MGQMYSPPFGIFSSLCFKTDTSPAYALTTEDLQIKLNEIKDQIATLSQGKLSMSIKAMPNTEDVVGTLIKKLLQKLL